MLDNLSMRSYWTLMMHVPWRTFHDLVTSSISHRFPPSQKTRRYPKITHLPERHPLPYAAATPSGWQTVVVSQLTDVSPTCITEVPKRLFAPVLI